MPPVDPHSRAIAGQALVKVLVGEIFVAAEGVSIREVSVDLSARGQEGRRFVTFALKLKGMAGGAKRTGKGTACKALWNNRSAVSCSFCRLKQFPITHHACKTVPPGGSAKAFSCEGHTGKGASARPEGRGGPLL